jgi:diguanylate cyclase (GGDEF)-like protein
LLNLHEERRRARQFERLALTDPLTGLANRRQADRWLAAPADDRRTYMSVAIVDLDHFKTVNDTYSHDAGDEVLRRTAAEIRGLCAEAPESESPPFPARLGGEEFLLCWRGAGHGAALQLGERLLDRIRSMAFPDINDALRVSASIGMATGTATSGHALLKQADACLYEAKRSGRDRLIGADATLS